jgi:hypothetical protein
MHKSALCVGGPNHLVIADLRAGDKHLAVWDKTWDESILDYRRSLTLYGLQRVGFGPDRCYLLLDEQSGRFLSESASAHCSLYEAFFWLPRLDVDLIHLFMMMRGERIEWRPGPPDEVFADVAAA